MKKRNRRLATLSVFALALVALGMVGSDLQAAADKAAAPITEAQLIAIGYRISPVPLEVKGKPQAVKQLIGLGSYLVNTGGCNDCHTNPPFAAGGDPYLGEPEQINTDGFLEGGQTFGPFTSRDLTRDEDGLPAGLTFAQFREVMLVGTDFENAHPQFGPLLQVMPWPVFGKMPKRHHQAIYEYLRAIPSDHQ